MKTQIKTVVLQAIKVRADAALGDGDDLYRAGLKSLSAAPHADSVERGARFPSESISALKAAKLLASGVPKCCGGAGATPGELTEIAFILGKDCAATSVIWAMLCIQVACIARHSERSSWFEGYLPQLCPTQALIASITSEVAVGGDIRLRDALSAACMIGNHRLLPANVDLAQLQRGDVAPGLLRSEL